MNLSDKKCVPCEGGTLPLTPSQIQSFLSQLKLPWELVEDKKIKHKFLFKGFHQALEFVNNVAAIAQAENHHPTILIAYNKVVITLITHSIGGLSENDFIMASKIEKI